MNLQKQLRCVYLHAFTSTLHFTDAVWVALLAARGFTLAQIGLAEGVFHGVSLLCEVPSGMAADLLGRRRTLIFGGALVFFLLEYPNPLTFQNYSGLDMGLASLFQSVTLRTAGFATMDLSTTTVATKFLMMILMFIGGSPGGTAGGIKTTTFFVLCAFIYTMLKGQEHVKAFHRLIPRETIIRASNVMVINLITLFVGIFLRCVSDGALGFVNLAFEAVSAMATVGLTLGITTSLSAIGKVIIILLMYAGRIGIATLLFSLIKMKRVVDRPISYPNGNILIG